MRHWYVVFRTEKGNIQIEGSIAIDSKSSDFFLKEASECIKEANEADRVLILSWVELTKEQRDEYLDEGI